ncbi:MAG: hypothetical protein CVU81_00435 [Euryarchaeota archaeon HGW-Euryarchaeota-1]|nr:MAG: hypothetical protein CVU81_00435 [Euryarchaeota archaeon HGW-Euryarchaeota-1]
MCKKIIKYFQTFIKNLKDGYNKNKTLLIKFIFVVVVFAVLFLLFPDLIMPIIFVTLVITLIFICVALFRYPSIKEKISQNALTLLVGMVLGVSIIWVCIYLFGNILHLTRDFYEGAIIVMTSITIVISFILSVILSEKDRLYGENESLRKDKEEIESSIGAIISEKNILAEAETKGYKQIKILGVNATGLIHYAKETLEKLLLKGCDIYILIVEENSLAFKKRVEIESAEAEKYKDEKSEDKKYKDLAYGRLLAELCGTIRMLYEIQETAKVKSTRWWERAGEIKLKLRTNTPKDDEWFALTLAEDGLNGFAVVRVYPKAEEKKRGLKGPTFFYKSNDSKTRDDYYVYLKKFNDLWGEGKKCDLESYNSSLKLKCE